MPSSSQTPKLPLWIFFATDAIFIGAAVWIARSSPHPLPELTALAIAGCVIAGAIAGLVPLVAYYERQKNETLDDRQRALEALARTVSSSAEQISIAAGGLHEIADIAQKNLKHAEQLPHKLQEKIAEFQAQLANANEGEREELERELEVLRAGESERLQTSADKVARMVAELGKLEAATQGHVAAANDALGKLSFGAAGAIGKAQVAAEQAFNQARLEASRGVGEASGKALSALATAKDAAIADITRHFDQQLTQLRDASTSLAALVERIEQATAKAHQGPLLPGSQGTPFPAGSPGTPLPGPADSVAWSAPLEPAAMPTTASDDVAPTNASSIDPQAGSEATSAGVVSLALPATPEPGAAPEPDTGVAAEPDGELRRDDATPVEQNGERQRDDSPPVAPVAAAPKRSRKHRAEPKPEVAAPAETPSAGEPSATQVEAEAGAPEPAAAAAPNPEPTEPAAPTPPPAEPAAANEPVAPEEDDSGPSALAPVESTRGRGRSRRAQDDQPGLGLDLGEFEGRPAPTVESVLSSDGATRLIVTAYIGIGNRLFIRGEGPGLSWDKGIPLQFVSIGKWRWETNDAAGPVKFKLLKNDEHESVGLGTLTLQPAHQNEVTAAF